LFEKASLLLLGILIFQDVLIFNCLGGGSLKPPPSKKYFIKEE
jgi:hypothetical protein